MPGDAIHEKLLAVLTPEWQEAEEVYAKIMPQVPPGKAMRTYKARSKSASSPLTEDEQIESGRRTIVTDRIGGSTRMEARVIDGKRMIRLKDRRAAQEVSHDGHCPTCGQGPFVPAPEEKMPPPARPRKTIGLVLRPDFPQWSETARAAGESG